jgi:dipeptidyl aminopeptidase/acylaminoacyl peptidase
MKKSWRRGLSVVILFFVVAYFGLSYFLSGIILSPRRLNMDLSKQLIEEKWNHPIDYYMDQLVEPTDFTVQSEVDQIELKGWYFKQPDTTHCGVVMAHGWNNNRTGLLKYAPIFWECGCDLVLYDHRGHFESGGDYGTGGYLEKEDLITVTSWLQERTGLRDNEIGWFGESWGGSTVLQAAGLDKDVAFVVADAPFQDWYTAIFERADKRYGTWMRYFIGPTVMWMVNVRAGINYEDASALKAAKNVVEPILINHSKTDTKTGSVQSANLASQLPKATTIFHHAEWGADHCLDVIIQPEEYKEMVRSFISEKVGDFGKCE